jgi:hypothetical protein
MVVDPAPMKAPEQTKEVVPSASEPKGNLLDIPELSKQGAKKLRASHIAIIVALKGIQFMNALWFFVVSCAMEIIRLSYAQIVRKQMLVLFLVVMLWKALGFILFQWFKTQKLMLKRGELWFVF